MNEEERARADIIEIAHRVYAKGWVANHDGNLSVRVAEDRIIATPTSVSKGDVRPEQLIAVDLSGNKLEGTRRGFSEFALHLAVYRARPDVKAVLHAHPVTAAGFAVAGVELDPTFMPEAVVSLGDAIPTAEFALPYGESGAAPLLAHVQEVDVMLLANHGVIGYGPDLWTAFYRVELVEHLARIQMVARQLGTVNTLSPEHIAVLLEKRRKAGLGPEARAEKAGLAREAPRGDIEPGARPTLPEGAAPSVWTGVDPVVESPAPIPSQEELQRLVDEALERFRKG